MTGFPLNRSYKRYHKKTKLMNTENIYLALQLMVVGMATVFLILYIIIGLGKLLVNYTNANAKEAPPVSPPRPAQAPEADATTQAVIQLAIKELTRGKGHVTQIKKLP